MLRKSAPHPRGGGLWQAKRVAPFRWAGPEPVTGTFRAPRRRATPEPGRKARRWPPVPLGGPRSRPRWRQSARRRKGGGPFHGGRGQPPSPVFLPSPPAAGDARAGSAGSSPATGHARGSPGRPRRCLASDAKAVTIRRGEGRQKTSWPRRCDGRAPSSPAAGDARAGSQARRRPPVTLGVRRAGHVGALAPEAEVAAQRGKGRRSAQGAVPTSTCRM